MHTFSSLVILEDVWTESTHSSIHMKHQYSQLYSNI